MCDLSLVYNNDAKCIWFFKYKGIHSAIIASLSFGELSFVFLWRSIALFRTKCCPFWSKKLKELLWQGKRYVRYALDER